jgi:hypothetical protein
MSLFVSGLPLERKRIDRELRTLFDEDVFLAVVPVGEARHVRAHRCKRFALFNNASVDGLCRLAFSAFEGLGSRGLEVHLVRIDNFGLFFQVECLLVAFENRLRSFIWEILFVIGEQLRVGVAHKSVCAARFTHAFVANGEFNV